MARIIFAGSPSVAVPFLQSLAMEHDVVSVITRVDSPLGRKRVMTETPVAVAAHDLGIPVIKSNSIRSLEMPTCDLGVVVAYGGMIPSHELGHPKHGWINAHFSLLPSLRGAAPVQRGLWNGDKNTGLSVFSLVEEMDAGALIHQQSIDFLRDETASEALTRIAGNTAHVVSSLVDGYIGGEIQSYPQSGPVSFAPKFTREDGRIDWTLPAETINSRIRAVTDEPGAFTEYIGSTLGVERTRVVLDAGLLPGHCEFDGDRAIVGTGTCGIELVRVKPAGKNSMLGKDWARGLRGEVVFS